MFLLDLIVFHGLKADCTSNISEMKLFIYNYYGTGGPFQIADQPPEAEACNGWEMIRTSGWSAQSPKSRLFYTENLCRQVISPVGGNQRYYRVTFAMICNALALVTLFETCYISATFPGDTTGIFKSLASLIQRCKILYGRTIS